jgi:hypothetical protein
LAIASAHLVAGVVVVDGLEVAQGVRAAPHVDGVHQVRVDAVAVADQDP